MKKLTVVWAAGFGLLTVAVVVGNLRAAADDAANAAINKIADFLEKGDVKAAKKAAKDEAGIKSFDLEDYMNAFKLRTKKGIGVGPKANAVQPDGIELKLDAIARDGVMPAALQKEGPALARAGYVLSAVAHIALAKPPEKDIGKQTKKAWNEGAESLLKSSEEFTAAAKSASAADVKKAASKIKLSCDNCHAIFK